MWWTDSNARCVEDSIGDCRRCADDTEFTQAFETQGIDNRIAFIYEDHVDIMHVGVDRHKVVGQIRVDDTSVAVVEAGALQ